MVNNNLKCTTSSACHKALLLLLLVLCTVPASAKEKKGNKPATDTFKIAKQFIAKKKFAKANKVLKRYRAAHPKDLNALWLQAQTNLYANNYRQSYNNYQAAITLAPTNDYLKLNYIHSLADMGRTGQAENMLYVMENNGADYSNIALLHARLYYYNGDNNKAAAYIRKAMQYDNQAEAGELSDLIEMARSPKASLSSSYLSDNQPLTAITSTIKAEKYFSKSLSLFLACDDYHFMQNKVSDAPWIRIGNKMFFPKAGLHLSYGAGIMQFPVKKDIAMTGEVNLNIKISQQFDLDLGVDHVPYFGTKSSVDTAITATRFNAMLNWHKNNWLAQAAFINSNYPDNNNVYAAYAYFLAPIVVFPTGKLQMGLSHSHSNSTENRYVSEKSLNDILLNYTPNAPITGIYDPYFTPGNLVINSALLSFNVAASKKVDISISGDVGYGSIYNPYLYLDKTGSGTVYIAKGYGTEYFTPYSASAGISYHIDKTWLLAGKYTYRSTYFFNSNYVTVGLEKSFQHRKKNEKANGKKTAFSNAIQDIEDKIQALYRCKNSKDLKQSVSSIRSQVAALRDAQQKRKSMTEVTPNSEEAALLTDRYNSLTEMLSEIDGVNLDDKDDAGNKREWLVDKQYELSSIRYNGLYDSE